LAKAEKAKTRIKIILSIDKRLFLMAIPFNMVYVFIGSIIKPNIVYTS